MPLRFTILLSATFGIIVLIVIGILITVLVTSKVIGEKHDQEIKKKFFKKNKKEEANQ